MIPETMPSAMFLLFCGILLSPSVLAGVAVRPRHCGGAIRHVHLAVGPDPKTSMTVSFASIPSHYQPAPVAGVAFGSSPDDMNVIVVAQEPPSRYNVTAANSRMANGPPNAQGEPQYWSPYYHHITISNLQPNTVYYYQPLVAGSKKDLKRSKTYLRQFYSGSAVVAPTVVDSSVETNGEKEDEKELSVGNHRWLAPPPYDGYDNECPSPDKVRFFRTAPENPDTITRLAIVGDLGQFPHSQETLQRLYRSPDEFDIVLLAGDIAYAGTDGRKWDTFFDFWDDTPLAERIPVSCRLVFRFVVQIFCPCNCSPTLNRFIFVQVTTTLTNLPTEETSFWHMNTDFVCLESNLPNLAFTKDHWVRSTWINHPILCPTSTATRIIRLPMERQQFSCFPLIHQWSPIRSSIPGFEMD